MGASISQRPGKCLKNRRTKSEEVLGSKQQFKNNMGRFFAPWHYFIHDNIANNNQDTVNATRYFTYNDWVNKDSISVNMEKSFNEIHRSNSLDKNDYETDYEKLVMANFGHTAVPADDEDTVDGQQEKRSRLTIDVNKDSIFEVNLRKGSRGLGFSILEYDGFIFIKQLFPLEAAMQCGQLQEGDIILSANGTPLTDLTSFDALHILRTLQNPVTLIVCRLQQFLDKKPISSSHVFSNFGTFMRSSCQSTSNEIEIEMKKVNGSLGFTLRKAEEEDCGHIVRALVKEPAISDGRIKPGDQIISVNGQEIDKMTHQEAVKFLRDCGDEVILRVRRDTLSSSLTSLNSSQFETHNKTLRKEALEMLNTLAVKKLKNDSEDKENNNDVECRTGNSSFDSTDDIFTAKRRDSLFDSRENLAALQYSDEDLSSNVLHDNIQMSGDLGKMGDEPVSLPALDVASNRISFRHNDPAYHSINVPNFSSKASLDDKLVQSRTSPGLPAENNAGLLKWKGVVLDGENEEKSNTTNFIDGTETLTVQLQRNWNSRLGFSLSPEGDTTIISAIHADSVAAKDGKLQVNDRIKEVNNRDVTAMETNEIIDLLRTVRGVVTIVVSRKLAYGSNSS